MQAEHAAQAGRRRSSVPDDMNGAQQSLLIALELRRDGLELRSPSGSAPRSATRATRPTRRSTQIAGQMQVVPRLRRALRDARAAVDQARRCDDAEIGGQKIAHVAASCPGSSGCEPTWSRTQLGQQLSAGAGRQQHRARPRPGLHGTGLDSVDRTATRRCSPTRPNRLTYARRTPTFAVKFTNQGENDEFDVKVTLKIEGGAASRSRSTQTVDHGRAKGADGRRRRSRSTSSRRSAPR